VDNEMYMEAGRIHKDIMQAEKQLRQSINLSRRDKS
jgi:hypothetical protein